MDDRHYEWGVWTRLIAIIEAIAAIIDFIVFLMILFVFGAHGVINPQMLGDGPIVVNWFGWLAVVVMTILTSAVLWTAVHLMKSTSGVAEQNATDAYKFCKYWRIVCVVNITFAVLCGIVMASYGQMVIRLLIRIVFLFVVQRFMKDLEEIIAR